MTNALRQSGKIGLCYWIAHKAEDEGEKDHIHFVLVGGQKTYNTEGLSPLWLIDQWQGGKGSVTNKWNVTKDIRDWLLYAIHNPIYLARKGLTRKYHYDWADIHCTTCEGDTDSLARDMVEARRFLDEGGDKVYRILRLFSENGETWEKVVLSGLIPLGLLKNAYVVYDMMLRHRHPPTIEG